MFCVLKGEIIMYDDDFMNGWDAPDEDTMNRMIEDAVYAAVAHEQRVHDSNCVRQLDTAEQCFSADDPTLKIGVITNIQFKTLIIGATMTVARKVYSPSEDNNDAVQYLSSDVTLGYLSLAEYSEANPVISRSFVNSLNAELRRLMRQYNVHTAEELDSKLVLMKFREDNPDVLETLIPIANNRETN
jgi:hypothetical protein